MENILDQIQALLTSHLAGIIVTIIGIILARYAQKLMSLIEEKLGIEIDDKAEQYILHLVRKSIRIVWQTYVKEKKRAGEFDVNAKTEALYKAADLVAHEARRSGFGSYLDKKEIINDIESELVKVKNDNKLIETTKPKRRRKNV